MAVNPNTVVSPLKRLKNMRVVHQHVDWSLAIGLWDNNPALLIRWNGDADHPMGNPVSHARATWFVLPEDFWSSSLSLVPVKAGTEALKWLNDQK